MRVKDARMVHWRVKQCAEEMAGAFYELQAHRDNVFYKDHWPSQKDFIRKNWRHFIVTARETLATMLTRDYPQKFKDEIYDALQLDANLPYSIQETQFTNIPH